MCGIAGVINFDGTKVSEDDLRMMMLAMKHRGPDDEGLFTDDNLGLGFVRLSILDLSMAGHQPMFSNDRRYCIIFNGEVYNYIELKEQLKTKYTFNSGTDTEVVLYSYIEWGADCLNRFNGMFAFVIYDTLTKELFGARDRFGIKPLYYFKNQAQFLFASDIPPILTVIKSRPEPNDSIIMNYLMLNRTNYSDETFFKGIMKIKPGHQFKIDKQGFIVKQWYDVRKIKTDNGFSSPGEYYNSFRDSIRLQLRSDVPVGICLSGGLDSSAIASVILKEYDHERFHSYSAIYNPGDRGDEQEFIREFQGSSMIMHYTSPKHKDLLNDLNQYVEALVEPLPGTSEYAEYKVMQMARNHSTVILNGQGADEVLGGYEYFYGAYLKELLFNFRFSKLLRVAKSLNNNHELIKSIRYMVFYLTPSFLKFKLLTDRKKLINERFLNSMKAHSVKLLKDLYGFSSLKDFFIRHFEYKFEHHLLWADKSGMYFSIETRFPFLDHRLVERTLATHPDLILNDGWTKFILREGFKGVLPEKIRLRKSKIGYETPEHDWLRTEEFKKLLNQLFESESFNNRKYFNCPEVKKLYADHLSGKVNEANSLWKIVHLELWLRRFID